DQNITPSASGGTVTSTNIYREASIFGLFSVPITINSVEAKYQGKAGVGATGPAWITNPSTCDPATFTLTAISYLNQTATASDSFTPTGCGTTPQPPAVTI